MLAPEAHKAAHMASCSALLDLPREMLELVYRQLGSQSLLSVLLTCKRLNPFDEVEKLSLVSRATRATVLRMCRGQLPEYAQQKSWLERLFLEEALVGFDIGRCEQYGFQFIANPEGDRLQSVELKGMGPKLLLSDASTADRTAIRWRLLAKGNMALEFGVVPMVQAGNFDSADFHRILHKCNDKAVASAPCVGFSSSITAGSQLPIHVALPRFSTIDITAYRGSVEYVITHQSPVKETPDKSSSESQCTPQLVTFRQEFPASCAMKLAATCWACASYDVLHHVPMPARTNTQQPSSSNPMPFQRGFAHDSQSTVGTYNGSNYQRT